MDALLSTQFEVNIYVKNVVLYIYSDVPNCRGRQFQFLEDFTTLRLLLESPVVNDFENGKCLKTTFFKNASKFFHFHAFFEYF